MNDEQFFGLVMVCGSVAAYYWLRSRYRWFRATTDAMNRQAERNRRFMWSVAKPVMRVGLKAGLKTGRSRWGR